MSIHVTAAATSAQGCGGWSFSLPGSSDAITGLVHVQHIAVDPDWAQQGVARAIFNRCASVAKAAGAARIQTLSSLNAAPFYAKLGCSASS
jgi:N-acetylglutamate synthase-like GNAT family acetyltransferase